MRLMMDLLLTALELAARQLHWRIPVARRLSQQFRHPPVGRRESRVAHLYQRGRPARRRTLFGANDYPCYLTRLAGA